MKVVSQNTEADLAARAALRRSEQHLRELAANILRVARGAGRPHDLPDQALAFVTSVEEVADSRGHALTGQEFAAMLDVLVPAAQGEDPHASGQRQILSGSMQVAASTLLGQLTHQRHGMNEVYDGLIQIEAERARARKEAAAAQRASRPIKRREG